ncbi:hypothetical protein OTU49_016585, partial [Cherax quadricarinatus]
GECPPRGVAEGGRSPQERWYYSPQDGSCASFRYSGCGGNSNNHVTYTACLDACTSGTCCHHLPQVQPRYGSVVEELNTTDNVSISLLTKVHRRHSKGVLQEEMEPDTCMCSTRDSECHWHCRQVWRGSCGGTGRDDMVVVSFSSGPAYDLTPAPTCGCRLPGKTYAVGEVMRSKCQECKCLQRGTFTCKRLGEEKYFRKEFRELTPTEMRRYQGAIRKLVEVRKAGWHYLTRMYTQHLPNFAGTDRFLPWHRYLLWLVDVLLQEDGSCDLSVPYFDWTPDVGDMSTSAAWQANYFGGDGDRKTLCVTHHPFRSP